MASSGSTLVHFSGIYYAETLHITDFNRKMQISDWTFTKIHTVTCPLIKKKILYKWGTT